MPEAFGANNSGTGVGGSMLHWGAFVPRPDPRDLRLRSETGAGEDWPITHDELLPYLCRVEAAIGVSGPAAYPWDPTRAYPLPPVALNAPAQMMQAGCDALGIRSCAAPARGALAGLVPARCARPARLHQLRLLPPGLPDRRQDQHGRHLPAASGGGRGPKSAPAAWCTASSGTRPAVSRGWSTGAAGSITASAAARCSCAPGRWRRRGLLLHTGLANASGQVGRNYMAHLATQVWGTFGQEMRPNKGYPSSLITEDMVRPADADFAGGYLVQSLGVVPVTFATQVARGRGLWGQRLVDYIDRYNHVAGIGNQRRLPAAARKFPGAVRRGRRHRDAQAAGAFRLRRETRPRWTAMPPR